MKVNKIRVKVKSMAKMSKPFAKRGKTHKFRKQFYIDKIILSPLEAKK